MTRRILRIGIPAAVAALVIIAVGLWPETGRKGGPGGSGRVYGMTDVPALLRNAKTVHLLGTIHVPPMAPPGVKQTPGRFEIWVDCENARVHGITPTCAGGPNGMTITAVESVSDGFYTMTVQHADKTVIYEKLSPFQRRLQLRQSYDAMVKQMLGDPGHLDSFVRMGQENIGGTVYDVWQGEMAINPALPLKMRLRYSLSPTSGDIGRMQGWFSSPTEKDVWLPALELATFERDAVPPPNTFSTDPPAGYKVSPTKEAATVRPLQQGECGLDNVTLGIRISFLLDDGSVIVGWTCKDPKAGDAQVSLFNGLAPGGDLPQWPFQPVGLKPVGAPGDVAYVGRHLAYTRQGSQFHEWAIYIPDRAPPASVGAFGYSVQFRTNPPDRKLPDGANCNIQPASSIVRQEFDTFVRGAIAELSDNGVVPGNVTYENVVQLSRQIRESLKKQAVTAPHP